MHFFLMAGCYERKYRNSVCVCITECPIKFLKKVGVWVYGEVGVWVYGKVGVWVYGKVGVWVYGEVGVWVYVEVGVWFIIFHVTSLP